MYALLRRLRSFRSFLTRKTASRSRRFSRFQRGRFIRDHFADEIRFWKLFPIGLRWLDSASIKVSTIITGHPTIVLQRDKTWNVYRVVRRNVHPFVCVHRSDLHEPLHESTEETRSEKLAALVVRFTTLFSVPLSSSVSTRHVFARASALATREYDSLNRIGRMIIIPWTRLPTGDVWYLVPLFFFCFIFDPLEGETRNLIRYSLDTLGWVNSRFLESQRWLGNDRNEIR